jgi:hypothetical protein
MKKVSALVIRAPGRRASSVQSSVQSQENTMRIQQHTATARRRWRFLAVPALAALALTVALARPASAAVTPFTVRSEANIFAIVGNPCTGEPMVFQGVDHLLLQGVRNDDGLFHVQSYQTAELTGTDSQGNEYVAKFNLKAEFDGLVGVVQTTTITTVAVSHSGAAPNFVVHTTLHITLNPDGTVTVQVASVTANCSHS